MEVSNLQTSSPIKSASTMEFPLTSEYHWVLLLTKLFSATNKKITKKSQTNKFTSFSQMFGFKIVTFHINGGQGPPWSESLDKQT